MVFHITNYMRETNTWMIRKGRWVLWCTFGSVPFYRNTYWDYLGRRVAWKEYFDGKTEAERIADADTARADWGYRPRYTPVYDFSIKQRKYDAMSAEERVADTPRLRTASSKAAQNDQMQPKEVRTIISILSEHNRAPGVFDYNFPQNFYSTFPEIERESFVTLGSSHSRRVHNKE
jgi:hypothetical protein